MKKPWSKRKQGAQPGHKRKSQKLGRPDEVHIVKPDAWDSNSGVLTSADPGFCLRQFMESRAGKSWLFTPRT